MKPEPLGVSELVVQLSEQTSALAEAVKRSDEARAREISARNAVNSTQAALDAAMAKVRESAPRDTNWSRRKADEHRPN